MTDDAIATNDVSADEAQAAADQEQQPAGGQDRTRPVPSERERRLADIAREYEKAHGIERGEAEEEESDPVPDPDQEDEETEHAVHTDDAPGDEADEDSDAETISAEQADAPDDPLQELGYYRNARGELVTKMKINGEEREVKADHVKAYLQKDIAGDYKLQQAAERERRLQEKEQLLSERETQIQQSLSQQPPKPLGADEAREQAKAVLERVWDGDSEAAAEALVEFLQRNGNAATVDPNQILSAAEQRALTAIEQREQAREQAVWQQSVDEGNRFLYEQHPEIYNDQRLFDLVNGETARMVQAQQAGDPTFTNLTPKDIIARAAEQVQGWMDERSSPKRNGNRRERKAGLKPMPKGMSRTPSRQKPQEPDTSPAAVIQRMRAARAVNS